jgi:hypothetical protein
MQGKVSVFQELAVPPKIEKSRGIDIQSQEVPCNQTSTPSRVTTDGELCATGAFLIERIRKR